MTKPVRRELFAMIVVMVLVAGCGLRGNRSKQGDATEAFLAHHVNSGESLALLAEWYTGDATSWRDFFIPAASSGAHRLQVGDEILIPRARLLHDQPPSEDYIRTYRAAHPLRVSSRKTVKVKRAGVTQAPVPVAQQGQPGLTPEDRDEGTYDEEPEASVTTEPAPAEPSLRAGSEQQKVEELEQAFMEEIIGR